MLALLKQRNFALLWCSGLISFMGDWALFVALPLYIYTLTNSVAAMGILFIVGVLPGLLLGSFAGVFADRYDRRWVIIGANLALAPLYCLLLLFASPDTVWIAYLVSIAANTIRQLLTPAEMALLPKLVDQDQLISANALDSLNGNLARLIGPAMGGVMFAWFGFHASVLFDVATFVVAALLVLLISAPSSVTRAAPSPEAESAELPVKLSAFRTVFVDWLSGLNLIRNNRTLWSLMVLIGILNIADGVITVLLIVFVEKALGGGSPELGWLLTAQAVGGLIGSALVARVGRKLRPWQMIVSGLFLVGIVDSFVWLFPILPLDLTLLMVVGVPITWLSVSAITLFQTATEDRYRGRVFGAFGTTSSLLLLVGRIFATFVGGQLDVVLVLVSTCSLYIFAGFLALRLLRDPNQAVLTPAHTPVPATQSVAQTVVEA
jgi:Na+/melibiose symporter-like transporter